MDEKINEICEKLAGILIDIKDMRALSDSELDAIKAVKDTVDVCKDGKRYLMLASVYMADNSLRSAERSAKHIITCLQSVKENAHERDEYYPDGDFLKELA